MGDDDGPAERFEAERTALRAMARRMLGSAHEAEDAVQEAWLRLRRADPAAIDNVPAWLRTTVARLCLDELRARRSRREDRVEPAVPAPDADPADQVELADTVSRALLAVLDTLAPAERIAFVLHDMFAMPFDDIAPLVDRSPSTTKKLASRARRKVRGARAVSTADLTRHRRVVEAFLAAARAGDLDAVLAVLDAHVVRRADAAALPPGAPREVRGARGVAASTMALGGRAADADIALVGGAVGAVVVRDGRLVAALSFTVRGDLVAAYDVIADPDRLARLEIALLPA